MPLNVLPLEIQGRTSLASQKKIEIILSLPFWESFWLAHWQLLDFQIHNKYILV